RDADRPHARAAPAVGDAEGLVQVQETHVRADVARPAQSHLGVELVCRLLLEKKTSSAPDSARCVQRLSTRQFLISTGLFLPDDSIAKRVVQTSLRIHEDDMVVIDTWQHTIDLASDIALECLRTGAKPLITLMTARLWWK